MKQADGVVGDVRSIPLPVPVEQHSEHHPCIGCPRWMGAKGQNGLVLDRDGGRAYWRGVDANVTQAEFRVLNTLLVARGEFVTYRLLYDALKNRPGFIAGQDGNGNSNMRSAIKRIRRKFLKLDPEWDNIQNYQAFGYAWRRACP